MRKTMIDTDNLNVEEVNTIIRELDALIRELRVVRARKLKAEELNSRMNRLLAEAKENGFIFINDYTRQVLPQEYIKVSDAP